MDRGVDPADVFSACGLRYLSAEEYDAPIPVEQVACLFERAAEVTDNPSMGLSMGQDFHYESSSLLVVAMLAAPDVAESLRFLNVYDRYIDTGIVTRFFPKRTPVEFSACLLHEGGNNMAQLNEYLMGFLVQSLRTATRDRFPLLEVSFQHNPPADTDSLREFFGCGLRFKQPQNSIRFAPELLQQPFMTSNKLLFRVLSHGMDNYFGLGEQQQGFFGTVCRQVMLEQSLANVDADTIADRLSMSPRTLRRRLSEEGFTFQEAKNLARERRAKYLLSNSASSLSEIAFDLGYSELSAFSRAFRNWVGETPQAYRDNIRSMN